MVFLVELQPDSKAIDNNTNAIHFNARALLNNLRKFSVFLCT
ncbi:hypothetical protein GPUN_1104 [Glaciecola punicea ACAM 611]|uniref:Uncharacterized protein n=1 Tax=Glaciecola punicea ACAM 611 TaxID=1121923 RepID=H5TAA8_9ALTE|nr:hypothetical protein GPUN_1104 [Glaciecola punicea ACAM 611]